MYHFCIPVASMLPGGKWRYKKVQMAHLRSPIVSAYDSRRGHAGTQLFQKGKLLSLLELETVKAARLWTP